MTDLDLIVKNSDASTLNNEHEITINGFNSQAKTKKPNEYPNLMAHILEHITTVAHTCIFGFVAFVLFLSFKGKVVLFTWHPILYSVGWMLFMTEAVLMISKDNIFSRRISHNLRVRWHWILQVLAVSMSIAGFVIVVVNKENGHKKHFKSWHGFMGLLSMIFCIPVCLNGIAALFNIELRNYISPQMSKFFHAVTGIITCVLGGITMVLSTYTGWFGRATERNEPIFYISFMAISFGILWSLFRPMITFFKRIKSV